MPINQIKSFAKQSGKSENEVEKLYQKAKDIAKESEREEDYGYIIGILKKMLKLEEKTEMDKEFLQSIKPEILEHILEYVKEQGIEDITKEMVLEMKETYEKVIEEKKGDKKEYTEFFQKTLEKYGVKSPSELSEEDKKKFYEEIDSGWESDIEEDAQLGRKKKLPLKYINDSEVLKSNFLVDSIRIYEDEDENIVVKTYNKDSSKSHTIIINKDGYANINFYVYFYENNKIAGEAKVSYYFEKWNINSKTLKTKVDNNGVYIIDTPALHSSSVLVDHAIVYHTEDSDFEKVSTPAMVKNYGFGLYRNKKTDKYYLDYGNGVPPKSFRDVSVHPENIKKYASEGYIKKKYLKNINLYESLALLSSGDNIGFSMNIKDVLYEMLSENENFIEIKELSKQYT